MSEAILGLSAFYHDSAAALLVDGQIIAAAQEERFTRKKHDPAFPANALAYVMAESGLALSDLAAVAFYDKPYLKFERLLETYHGFAPRGLRSFLSAMPVWIKEKLMMRTMLKEELAKVGDGNPPVLFPEHHLSHAASAFYPSPFPEAAILTLDGVGEWATSTIGFGRGRELTILRELHFPHSLGLLYSAFTYYTGFKVNSGEYKLMGLAPYGNPEGEQVQRFKSLILDELVDLREDGSLLLNMDYFDFATGLTMCRDDKWESLFGVPRRPRETLLDQRHMNLALAVQQATEEIVLRLAETAKKLTGADYLVMAGGVALNCVANGKLIRRGTFKDIWIQPAAGDAGGALGAALAAWHIWQGKERLVPNPQMDNMAGSYLGPEFGADEILRVARRHQAPYQRFPILPTWPGTWRPCGLKGRWWLVPGADGVGAPGPGQPQHPGGPPAPGDAQKRLNLNIKYREGFRPLRGRSSTRKRPTTSNWTRRPPIRCWWRR